MHVRKQVFKKTSTDQLMIISSNLLFYIFLYPRQIQTRVEGDSVWYVLCDFILLYN